MNKDKRKVALSIKTIFDYLRSKEYNGSLNNSQFVSVKYNITDKEGNKYVLTVSLRKRDSKEDSDEKLAS